MARFITIWDRCLLRLIKIGKEKQIPSLMDIETRITETPKERKVEIFKSAYMWESIKHIRTHRKKKLESNSFYTIKQDVYDEKMLLDMYADYYIDGIKADESNPIKKISKPKTKNKKTEVSEMSDWKNDLAFEHPKDIVEGIWEITEAKMGYQRFEFRFSENFMFGIILRALDIDSYEVNKEN